MWVEARWTQETHVRPADHGLRGRTSLVTLRGVTVDVRYEGAGRTSLPLSQVRTVAQRMLTALRMPDATLSVLLCDDAVIHALNRQHRRKDRPTDVLAFAMAEGMPLIGDNALLGDIVVSLPTAQRQAETRGRTLVQEVTMLLAHGLLHLLGDDHATDAQERRMTARTDMLVAAGLKSARKTRPKIA